MKYKMKNSDLIKILSMLVESNECASFEVLINGLDVTLNSFVKIFGEWLKVLSCKPADSKAAVKRKMSMTILAVVAKIMKKYEGKSCGKVMFECDALMALLVEVFHFVDERDDCGSDDDGSVVGVDANDEIKGDEIKKIMDTLKSHIPQQQQQQQRNDLSPSDLAKKCFDSSLLHSDFIQLISEYLNATDFSSSPAPSSNARKKARTSPTITSYIKKMAEFYASLPPPKKSRTSSPPSTYLSHLCSCYFASLTSPSSNVRLDDANVLALKLLTLCLSESLNVAKLNSEVGLELIKSLLTIYDITRCYTPSSRLRFTEAKLSLDALSCCLIENFCDDSVAIDCLDIMYRIDYDIFNSKNVTLMKIATLSSHPLLFTILKTQSSLRNLPTLLVEMCEVEGISDWVEGVGRDAVKVEGGSVTFLFFSACRSCTLYKKLTLF